MSTQRIRCKLGELLTVKHGHSFKGEYFSESGNYILLTPGNFIERGGFKRTPGKEKYYTGKFPKEYICAKGDLIIAMTEQAEGLLGSTAIVPVDNTYLHNQRVGLIGCDPECIDKSYLQYLFSTQYVRKQIKASASGTKVKHTSPSRIYDVSVELPEIAAQRAIGKLLSSIDLKIELNNRAISELGTMVKVLYEYWFEQFDFPDKNGRPYKSSGGRMAFNHVLKREIPSDWSDCKLSDMANIVMGQSPPGSSYNEVGEGVPFFQGCTDFGQNYPEIRQYTTNPTRFAPKNSILLSVRAPVGELNITIERCCIGRGLASLSSKAGSLPYLFGVMQGLGPVFDRRNSDGTTFGAITKDDLYSIKVIKPSSNLIMRYHAIARPIFEQQGVFEDEIRRLTKIRDWLLPMLMNGQVEIKEGSLAGPQP